MSQKQFVIIGNSAAGIAAAEAIRQNDKDSKILIFSDEEYSAYCRCLISYYLAGDIKEDKIRYRQDSFYKDNNIELSLNKKVIRIDPKKSRITLEGKNQFSYDALLIATGASPKFPDTKGIKKKGIFGFRTIQNVKDIYGLLPVTKAASVMGGGLVGLKAAYGLKKRGVDVKVIIKSGQVLSQMLDFEAAGFVQRRLEENGIEIILGQDVSEIIGEGDIRAVKLDSGKAFESSMIIVGKGVSPNIDLVKDTEVKLNEGIVSDNSMRTNIPNIYVAGDCAESFDIALGEHSVNALWPVAVEQGKIAGANMSGDNFDYAGSVGMNSIEFFGLPIISLGVYKTREGDTAFEELKARDVKENTYKKIILKDGLMVGAVCVGDIRNSGVFLRLIRERINVSPIKDKLLQDNFGYPDIMEFIKDKEKMYV
jgi:nitrite reductase (NADH) large subunit